MLKQLKEMLPNALILARNIYEFTHAARARNCSTASHFGTPGILLRFAGSVMTSMGFFSSRLCLTAHFAKLPSTARRTLMLPG